MKFIIFITLFVCAYGEMSQTCLTSNSRCVDEDISVLPDDRYSPSFPGYTICGEPGTVGAYPMDALFLPSQGSGKMRKPEECDDGTVCQDILSAGEKDQLICANTILDISECRRFKAAKHCVTDVGNLWLWIGVGVVLISLCVCAFRHRERTYKRRQKQRSEYPRKI